MTEDETTAVAVEWINKHTKDYKLYKRVPELPLTQYRLGDILVAIIDLETMGLFYKTDKIIEIGILIISLDDKFQFRGAHYAYNCFQYPGKPIPDKIVEITGITDKMVRNQKIDWDHVMDLVEDVDYVLCHNASFDRKFLENQTPELVAKIFRDKKFGCTKKGIDWGNQGYTCDKLDYLNWANEYFYESHRALSDCWATLNIVRESGSFPELMSRIEASGTLAKIKYSTREEAPYVPPRRW